MITPFSGISLVIHSLIIGSSKLFTWYQRRWGGKLGTPASEENHVRKETMSRAWLQVLLSLFFMNVISAFILISFFFALKSGIEEGLRAPHIQYMKGQYERLRDAYPALAYQEFLHNTVYYKAQ